MSRDTALVSADWAEKNLDAAGRRLRRGRRGHHRLRRRPHRRRHQARLEDGPAGPGPPGLRQQAAVRGAAVRARHRQRRHRRPLRRQQQLVRRVRVLVLQALRPRRRQAARRRPQEVGARRPPARHRRGVPRRATTYAAQEQDLSIRAFRDEVVAAIGAQEPGRRALARRVRRPAARPGPPAAGAGAAGRPHPDRAAACRGPRRPTRTAPSSPTTSCATLYGEAGLDDGKDTIAYCRIGERSSHTWFVLRSCSGTQNVKNYDGSWTEYGSLVGVPVALGDEPGEA